MNGEGRPMQAYHELLERVLREGVTQADRTGVGTLSVFGHLIPARARRPWNLP